MRRRRQAEAKRVQSRYETGFTREDENGDGVAVSEAGASTLKRAPRREGGTEFRKSSEIRSPRFAARLG